MKDMIDNKYIQAQNSKEAKENMAFKLEQAKASMAHSAMDGTTKYVPAVSSNIRVMFARIMSEQQV